MNLKQAEKQFADFTNDVIKEHLNSYDFTEFCINFLDLMEREKIPTGGINLFANLSALYLWSENYMVEYGKIEFFIQKYLDMMKSQ